MVDFSKRLAGKKIEAVVDPVKLYDTLDRASDKGPLRPAQIAVLTEWFSTRRSAKDVIVKLHTGQGKTLIGLLMLQSRLNEKAGTVLYLCPNNFLIQQTRDQAKQFGIATCEASPDLPDDFHTGKSILVTSVQKLFNGLTRFGLGKKAIRIDTLLMDDAHVCSDTIRDACRIRLPNDTTGYNELLTLFAADLEQQGIGTYADICNKQYGALLPVPYWAWIDRESEVAQILSRYANTDAVRFAWPLIKDMLGQCQCVVSGGAIEIEPYIPPLDAFGTYWTAAHRIFMSATVTDDAFLVKGLQLSPETITNPLTYSLERWSGEKMVLIPSLIHEALDRGTIVQQFGTPIPDRKYGVVALVPSFNNSRDWKNYGAKIADTNSVATVVEELKQRDFDKAVVLVNRYDGIDLPDDTCRILILDSKPYSESLIDLYQEVCREGSQSTIMRTVRTVEQGLGRSVRGEKDYSVIVITGADITRLMRDMNTRTYLSNQMATQIQIGLDIAEMARQEIENQDEAPLQTLNGLIRQGVGRDPNWKAFYSEQMDSVKPSGANKHVLEVYAEELIAEQKYRAGDYAGAVSHVQTLLDKKHVDEADRPWYLQEMARYNYRANPIEAQRLQVAAHNANRLLLRPTSGVTVTKLTIVSEGRMERIIAWAKQYGNYQQLDIALSDILGRLVFGVKADKFEQALDDLSRALGFDGERPDKEWKEGPDNLWALDDTRYILWECKSEVDINRQAINKREAEQMNRSCAWFGKHYPGATVKYILVHPTNRVESAAAFTHEMNIMRSTELKRLITAVRGFFKSFETMDFNDLSATNLQKLIDHYNLSVSSLYDGYTKTPHDLKTSH